MKNRKVVKVGGSNLKEIHDIKKISKIICQYEHEPIVVVSAFYGVTNRLIAFVDNMAGNNNKISELIQFLYQLKLEYILALIPDEYVLNTVFNEIKLRLDDLSTYLTHLQDKNQIKPFERDYVLSYGERLSALVIWGILKCTKRDSELVLPENIGLVTDDVFGNASVNLRLSKKNLENRFNEGIIYVVPGFYGISPYGKINLLGRGGTDYSAAAIAYCVNASALDIWKDVDGFMTGDPKFIEAPNQVNHLSYTEAAELAYFGAGILHPRTVEPLQLCNIPIHIFNVHKDHAKSKAQTIIDHRISRFPNVVKSITFENNIGILSLKGPGVGFIPGILSAITKILHEHGINISSVITSQISINLLIGLNEIDIAKNLIESLDIHAFTDINANKEVSLIAVVGNGMTQIPGIAAKVFKAIADEGINILLSSLGASDVVTYFIIDKPNLHRAINKLHEALFKNEVAEEKALA